MQQDRPDNQKREVRPVPLYDDRHKTKLDTELDAINQ